MEDCIFCKIVDGQIPANIIYEDDVCLAFLDIAPTTKGHTLIIPKVHASDLFSMDKDTLMHIAKVSHVLANRLKSRLNCEGINILNNNGAKAGQTVFHYHMHLIPRYDETDGLKITFSSQEQPLAQLVELLK